jgi:hypothetical protein
MQIADNKCANADNNRTMRMLLWIPKSDNRIIRMQTQILPITTSAFSPLAKLRT